MAKKLWGGRFGKKTDPLVEEFTKSIHYDHKLAEYDLIGSIVHVGILKKAGYLTTDEAAKLRGGLVLLYNEVKDGSFTPDMACEDIHTDIQNRLEARLGEAALKLHTARSRNDQVVFAVKLYCKKAIMEIEAGVAALAGAIAGSAGKNKTVIMPGFTHMQHAQPVYLKDHLGAYCEMLKRDNERLESAFGRISLTMGAGALAGTPIPSNMYKVSLSEAVKGLASFDASFDVQMTANSLDAVSDRDFVIEIMSALAILGMHLSRMAEDIIIWSTKEFGFVRLDDAFCTGSSLMPQKKNPDPLEMVRGYAGRFSGNLVSVLMMMKGLPLTYNRDMQLDKEALFDSIELAKAELGVMTGLISSMAFDREKIASHLKDESLCATDLVYYLVGKGVAFSNAHAIVGGLVRYSAGKGKPIAKMSDAELKKHSSRFVKREIAGLFDPAASVASKKSVKRK